MRRINIGLLGCGTVGRGFVDLLARERERIRGRDGVDIAVRRILVRDADKPRPGINPSLLSTAALDILDDGCDIIVELVGGVHSAGAFVRRALANGKHVVTANKALLADSGRELFASAERNRVRIGFEASVCGGIPIVRALRLGLAGDRIESISGILNGTCNYILTRMEQDDLEFDGALRLAKERGFAEADSALDVGGEDAAQKLRILGELAFGPQHVNMRVHGIGDVTHAEIEQARARRCVVRHVATARQVGGGIEMRVERRELPEFHPLAGIRDENNAVVIRGRAVGELMFQGKGAGSLPTAAAVLSDVIEIAACSTMTP
ncbi:MAG: homoserine dehydrogenase [Acidobacteria bacterium]|nr:homoserine dehydrogenase [Acidobacteriota bacterium]MBV9067673.1 homoserine dehydrogenase [Acidobacteriota bacterium]MBV9185919.1 homoserine dehydrogenase [Acidobacteriota bacterium]